MAMAEHPEQFRILKRFVVSKIKISPKRKLTVQEYRALVAELSSHIYRSMLLSTKCQRALNVMVNDTAAVAGVGALTATKGKRVVIPVNIGAGGGLVLVCGAFAVGFIVGTHLAKFLGMTTIDDL
jgi:hypothetical protein